MCFRKIKVLRRWILLGHSLEAFRVITCPHKWELSEKKWGEEIFYDERGRKCVMISQECSCIHCGKKEIRYAKMYLYEWNEAKD